MAVAAAPALLLLTACSPSEVDIDGLEKEITSGVEDQTGQAVSVDCPDKVEWNTGGTFECDVETKDGQQVKAAVTMKNDDGDVAWEIK